MEKGRREGEKKRGMEQNALERDQPCRHFWPVRNVNVPEGNLYKTCSMIDRKKMNKTDDKFSSLTCFPYFICCQLMSTF